MMVLQSDIDTIVRLGYSKTDMSEFRIASEILGQYDRAFLMLRELVCAIEKSQWKAGPVPARWAYHAVDGAWFYSGDTPGDTDDPGSVDWEGPVELLPDQEVLLALAEKTQQRFHERWAGRSDEEMLGPTGFPWTAGTRLGQLMYNLRHMTYHIGELSMFVREQGATETPWH